MRQRTKRKADNRGDQDNTSDATSQPRVEHNSELYAGRETVTKAKRRAS